MPLSTGTRLGRYEIAEPLGAGGMGEVYRARDPRLNRDVAVKVVLTSADTSDKRLQRFEDEARAVAALAHPNVLTVFDVGTHEGMPYLVLELLEGTTLRAHLNRGPLPLRRAIELTVQACRGLQAAHAKGLIHRDLKPENLFLTSEGLLKILDFGLAKLSEPDRTGDGAEWHTETAPGLVLGTVGYLAPEQATGSEVDARADLFSLGTVLYEMLSGRRAFEGVTAAETLAALLKDDPPPLETRSVPAAVSRAVTRCLEKRPEDRFDSAHDLALALEVALDRPLTAPGWASAEERSPYPGLQSFTEADADLFFGREAEIEGLWARLQERRLLAVIGPSGVGKTSLVRAGVVASRASDWSALVCVPGGSPFRRLGQALAPELSGDPDSLRALVSFDDPDTAFTLMERWRRAHAEVLLVVDQFEELFTLSRPEEQGCFASFLGRLANEGEVHVLLSLRDDFLMRCGEHEPLRRVFTELTPVLPLSGEALRRALVEPARSEGYAFEEGLDEEMLESVAGARGALPLLAFAVSRLWEERDRERRLLTREAYERVGGVAGALALHAEQTLERIGPERERLVRELFRNLATAQGTRASAEREELLSVFGEERGTAAEVLDTLIAARLLTSYEVPRVRQDEAGAEAPSEPDGHRIEVVHESLLKAWPRLVRWQAQDEDGAVLRDQLKQAAHLWEEKGRSEDLLWSGTAEREFEVWRERYPGGLTALEDDFAEAMRARERRRKKRRRLGVAALVAGSLAVAALVGVSRQEALQHAQRANREALRAEASKLLALAELRLEEDPTEALALTTASLGLADTPDARLFALRVLAVAPPAAELTETALGWGSLRVPSFSPDGRWLASGGHGPDVLVWPDTGEGPLVLPGHESSPDAPVVPRWLDPRRLVTGLGNGRAVRLHVWSLPSAQRLRTLELAGPTTWWTATGRLLTATSEAGGIPGHEGLWLRSWTFPGDEAEDLGHAQVPAGSSVAFAPGGNSLVVSRGRELLLQPLPAGSGGAEPFPARHRDRVDLLQLRNSALLSRDRTGELRVWSFPEEGPRLERVITLPESAPSEIEIEPSGRWVFDHHFTAQRRVRLWDTRSLPGAYPLDLRRGGSWRLAMLDFQQPGAWLVVSTHDTSHLSFWNLGPPRPCIVAGPAGVLRPVTFSHDGRNLVSTAWGPGNPGISLWNLPGSGQATVREIAKGGAVKLLFDPQGRYLVRLGANGRAGVVSVIPLDGSAPRELPGAEEDDTIYSGFALSPDGRHLARAFFYGKAVPRLQLWDLDTGALRTLELPPSAAPQAHGGYARGVADLHFADESTLYSAGDGGLRRWNLQTGSHEVIWSPEPEDHLEMSMSADATRALVRVSALSGGCHPVELHDLRTGEHRPLPQLGSCVVTHAIDPAGRLAATGDRDGIVRVGTVSGEMPHLLLGHDGPVQHVAISPDLRWVVSTGEDNMLRLWPMPNLEAPPLHTLPLDALLTKLSALTNLRAVRDPGSAAGWKIELDPFPGWRDAPGR